MAMIERVPLNSSESLEQTSEKIKFIAAPIPTRWRDHNDCITAASRQPDWTSQWLSTRRFADLLQNLDLEESTDDQQPINKVKKPCVWTVPAVRYTPVYC